jgi:AraC-like DNA-binding protein
MSKKRQPSKSPPGDADHGIAVRSFAVRHSHGLSIPPHSHDWHQLIYASEGAMWVRTEQGDWVAPPHRAVWAPAGVRHGIEMSGPVFVQTLYLAPRLAASAPPQCCAVNVSPLLRELVRHVVNLGTLDERIPAQARLLGVLLDQLSLLPAVPLQLPWPTDERATRAADWLREHPADAGDIERTARRVACGARTLERLFRKETGITFGKWRQQLRLLQAMQSLAAGRSVAATAAGAGYDSPSAFIAMFRRTLGTTPRRYFEAEGTIPPRRGRPTGRKLE